MRLKLLTPLAVAGMLTAGTIALPQEPLGVRPSQESPKPENKADEETAKKVRESLKQNQLPSQATHRIDVLVKDGKVFLSGTVASKEESDRAAKVAGEIAGASMVTNSLQVRP